MPTQTPPEPEDSGEHVVRPLSGHLGLSGNPAALIVNGPDRVWVSDFIGRSENTRQPDGSIEIAVTGRPVRGERNEGSVLDILAQRRSSDEGVAVRGRPKQREKGGDRGEDGSLVWPDGTVLNVQVVSVPADTNYGREVGSSDATRNVTAMQGAAWIDEAIQLKAKLYPKNDRAKMVLALDAAHASMLTEPDVLKAFEANFQSAADHGFAEIWLVGRVPARCIRLT